MADIEQLITTAMDTQNTRFAHGAGSGGSADHAGAIIGQLDIWSSAIKAKAGVGRGGSKKRELYGIKKLRELILELAVRGLLVQQDPNDEPASELLKRIATEKQQLIKDKKVKKQKALPPISDDEKPFELPEGWKWARLLDVGHDLGQEKPDQAFTYIDVGAINRSLGCVESPNILEASKAPSRARKLVKRGTVIYSTVRPYLLNIAVIDQDFEPEPIASTAFAIIHPLTGVTGSYIYRYLRSPVFVTYVESVQAGIAYPAINDKQFFSGLIPLPPPDEQHRIVAKVDELMALCDQLEQQTETSLAAHQTLVETVLAALTRPTAPNDGSEESTDLQTAGSSAKPAILSPEAILFEHFDTLFTTQHSIDQLKQTILQLAVMGKLVPQNPNDEPASELLKKIAAEKAQLIKDKKIKKQKPLPPIGDEEKSFALPVGWEWCRLQNVIDVRDGTHDSPRDSSVENSFPLVTSKNFVNGEIDFESARMISEEDHLEISKRSLVEVDDILFSMIGGNIGNQVIVKSSRHFSVKNVALFKYYSKAATLPSYFKLYTEELAIELQHNASGGAQPFVSLGVLRKLVFALPPKEEQYRIVTKVDELMTLCDQLKAHLGDAQTTQLHLAVALAEQGIA